jgi:hypothetical protein
MFALDEVIAEAIRAICAQESESSAAVALRRRCRLIPENVRARVCARTHAGRQLGPPMPIQ